MKRISILGSTGSIGTQALDVIRQHRDLFKVEAIAANTNVEKILEQIDEFSPYMAILYDENSFNQLKEIYHGETKLFFGKEGLIKAASYEKIDIVLTSLTGFIGLEPTLIAIKNGKDIALANKETLVAAGELVMSEALKYKVKILPVDSEHGAIFQCLQGNEQKAVENLILTASGGPLLGKTKQELADITVKECLNHPTWSMGKKITIDSATLVNKGLEVIEAHWLYNMPYEKIKTVIHPQSIVHSFVEYIDGSVLAQLAMPDMRLAIQYALNYPKRIPLNMEKIDFWQIPKLTFEKPDFKVFRGIDLAYQAGKIGFSMPCVLNAANEVAVELFLAGKIKFLDIYNIIEKTMVNHQVVNTLSLDTLKEIDQKARAFAYSLNDMEV